MFLLDAGGAALILLIPIAFIFLLFIWGLVEGFIINLFRINRFWKSLWHAIIVNIVIDHRLCYPFVVHAANNEKKVAV